MIEKDLGICIRKVDYSDSSQIVTFFTRAHGKLDAIAKGSKRAKSSFGGAIEIFSIGDMVFSKSESAKLATLTEFSPGARFGGLRRNLFALNSGLFGAELLNSFTEEGDADAEFFLLFEQFLEDIQGAGSKSEILGFLILFQLSFLGRIGTKLVLDTCANCKKDFSEGSGGVYFSSSANGMVCRDCEGSFIDKTLLSRGCFECFFDLRRIGSASEGVLFEMEIILVYHFTEVMGRIPKMGKYFLKKQ